MFPRRLHILTVRFLSAWIGCTALVASADDGEFFEKRIRPVLAEHCYECHSANAKKLKGGLRLDTREGLLKGGEDGPVLNVGEPDKSLLLRVVRHEDPDKQMPFKAPQLADTVVADLAAWIKAGATMPATGSASQASVPKSDGRTNWWAFRPVHAVVPQELGAPSSQPLNPIDAFIRAKLSAHGLASAPPADRRSLLRRATFDLTGLPPTPDEIAAFLADDSPEAFTKVVDRLLASPRYGETWARHWLDVVRYTDSFDARIVEGGGNSMDCAEAWRYRDWVVDAFNHDLRYDQFLTRQVAGDILADQSPEAQFDPGLIVATGIFALGNWGGGDADKEKLLTDIADDQVDVVGRAFLGLTIGCARCHDHKFDPISTEDYYALAGIFFSSHILPNPGPKTNGPDMLRIALAHKAELKRRAQRESRMKELEAQIAKLTDEEHAAAVQRELTKTADYLMAAAQADESANEAPALRPAVLRRWRDYFAPLQVPLLSKKLVAPQGVAGLLTWQSPTADNPSATANTTDETKGFFAVKLPPRSIAIHPSPNAGVAVGWRSPVRGKVRLQGMVADADAGCGNGVEWSLTLRGMIGDRELAKGVFDNGGRAGERELLTDTTVESGDLVQLAVSPRGEYSCDSTLVDLTVEELDGAKRQWNLTKECVASFHEGNPHADAFGDAGVWSFYDLAGKAQFAAPPVGSALAAWVQERARFSLTPTLSLRERGQSSSLARSSTFSETSSTPRLPDRLTTIPPLPQGEGRGEGDTAAIRQRISALALAVQSELLAETDLESALGTLKDPTGPFWAPLRGEASLFEPAARERLTALDTELRQLRDNPPPALAVAQGLQEGGVPESPQAGVHDVKVHKRGRYDRLGDLVPRGFPRVLAGNDQPVITAGSGRLELARWLAEPTNPLVARVMVNRIWQHHFGEGLVRTPNNFGKLGEPPTHPELLDWLAGEFVRSGWSVKAMHRLIMSSETYRQAAMPAKDGRPATTEDPENRLLSHFPRRRLPSEALRDSLLFVAGRLDEAPGGKAYRDFSTPRRTLYAMTIRSDRATYQSLFDAADPTGIVEKRLDSTVAPQALWLLNHPFALAQTKALTERLAREAAANCDDRIRWLYGTLFGRPPTAEEIELGEKATDGSAGSWETYAQVLLCSNEFIYVD